MAKGGGGKSPGIWYWLLAAVFYLPFSRYLASNGYHTADDFFEDLLLIAVLAALIIAPLALLYMLLFRTSGKRRDD